ncbi:acetyltransferase, GNAT family [Kutzneria sp. 744]|nr:acetyltransferase, GNAT family [Kutzneria sp. 744]
MPTAGVTVTATLLAAQEDRFARLDRVLPPAPSPDPGEVINAALPDGTRVAAVVTHRTTTPGMPSWLWSAADTYELQPLVGHTGAAGMDAVLRAFRQWLDRVGDRGPDTAVTVVWPSRDVDCTRVFLDHGLHPLTITGVRAPTTVRAPSLTVTVRPALASDEEAVVELAMAEVRYSAKVGAAILRAESERTRRAAMAGRLGMTDDVWVAERDGVVVGLAETAIIANTPGTRSARQLPTGLWGYVNCLSVLPGARGAGIGQQLMAVVHNHFAGHRTVGYFLHYNPPNPLSSVFWPRQGYRPLWTQWEVRPAGALR